MHHARFERVRQAATADEFRGCHGSFGTLPAFETIGLRIAGPRGCSESILRRFQVIVSRVAKRVDQHFCLFVVDREDDSMGVIDKLPDFLVKRRLLAN